MRNISYTIVLLVCLVCSNHLLFAQYSTMAKPNKQIKAARHEAKAKNKHIFVMIGGEWCIWCKRFDHLIQTDTAVAQNLKKNYIMVHVSYTKDNKNLPFLRKYKQPQRMGFPVFLVLDEKGKLIHTQNSAYLEKQGSDKGHDPKLVIEFLNHFRPGYDK